MLKGVIKQEKNGKIFLDGFSTSKKRKTILKEISRLVGFNLEDYEEDLNEENFEIEIIESSGGHYTEDEIGYYSNINNYFFIKYLD